MPTISTRLSMISTPLEPALMMSILTTIVRFSTKLTSSASPASMCTTPHSVIAAPRLPCTREIIKTQPYPTLTSTRNAYSFPGTPLLVSPIVSNGTNKTTSASYVQTIVPSSATTTEQTVLTYQSLTVMSTTKQLPNAPPVTPPQPT